MNPDTQVTRAFPPPLALALGFAVFLCSCSPPVQYQGLDGVMVVSNKLALFQVPMPTADSIRVARWAGRGVTSYVAKIEVSHAALAAWTNALSSTVRVHHRTPPEERLTQIGPWWDLHTHREKLLTYELYEERDSAARDFFIYVLPHQTNVTLFLQSHDYDK